MPYESVALKDVVWLGPSETVRVIARYAPWDGVYMFHCHNLIHEDHEMMGAFNVSVLADFNYTETTRFIDPMEPRYRSKSFPDSDFVARTGDFSDDSIQKKINFFAGLDAYAHVGEVEKALEGYWAGRPATTLATSSKTSSQSRSSTSTKTSQSTTTKTSASATRT